ncbi:hypothetical protein KSW81_006100 [Nannochloris sp. 'desiccata']|nr:hypothetical protein KSW81_006100 [Chlorella desiccata (nom. nud.)]
MVQTRSRGPALADINPGGATPAGQTAGRGGQRGSQRGGRGGRGSAPRNPISPTPRLPSPSPESNHTGQQPRDEEMSKVDFLKLAKDFPTFSGDNGVQPEDYLVQFSKMAKFTSFSSVQLMEVIPLKFTSIADTWFQQFQKSEDWQFLTYSDDPFATFCEFFTKRFSFGERNQLARDKLRSLEWRGNVVKLASLIQQHAAHTDITDSEQCDCFIRLLPTEMAEHVLLMRTVLGHHSFSEAITMASGHASGSASGQGKHSSGQRQGKSPYNNNNGVQKSSKTGVKPSVPGRKCWGCGSPDHLKKDCPKATTGVNMMDVDVKAQNPRFTSNFWRALMDHLGISLHMTAAYHPQSDGQAERHNRTIQDMLRAYVNPSTRDDWDEHLVALEFAYNNSVNRATGFSPFFMLYGQNPNTPASLLRATVSLSPAVDDFLARITETLTQSRTNLAKNQEQMQNQVNKRRRFVRYEVGERVLVDASRLYQAPRGKLTHKWVGPFEVAEVLNDNAYVLHLPPRLKNTSSTFNVTQLKRYQETDREFPRPPPIGYESGQPLYEFEKILAHRGPKNNRYYLVKWKGWPVDENLYEPASNLSGVQADVDAYEASIPVQRRKRSRR